MRRGGSGEIDAATALTIGAGHDTGAAFTPASRRAPERAGAGAGSARGFASSRDVAPAIATTASR